MRAPVKWSAVFRWILGRIALHMRLALFCTVLLLCGSVARSAELYYLDRDAFSNEYVGPVGPLVLSGEIAPGDYQRLLTKIAEDDKRFLSENKLILASSDGNAAEAMKIGKLLRSLYTRVVVGPHTGRCAGACFLIYAAAVERGTDGEHLLGLRRPGLAESEWIGMPTTQAALLEDSMQASTRDYLVQNEVPAELVEEVFKHPPTDVYWLSEIEEEALGWRSPSFEKFLAKNCKWSDSLEKAVLRGERPFEDLKAIAECRARETQVEASKALAQALKDASAPGTAPAAGSARKPHAKRVSASRKPPAENKTTPSS